MRTRPDLLDKRSPLGLEVFQLTEEVSVPAGHLYMEAQVFTPDSRHILLHRSCHAHGSDKDDPLHQYLLCDLADNCRLTPVTTETGVTAPSISSDGRYVYYFIDETRLNGGRLILKRVNLDGTDRRDILVLDTPVEQGAGHLTGIYPLSTISSDGQRLALSAFMGDGLRENAPYCLMVFDLQTAQVNLVLAGDTWCNIHPQYCRSSELQASHDILVQENHGCRYTADGTITTLVSDLGADLHVISDNGSGFRALPFGRDPNEACQGHECWRGESTWVISSTIMNQPSEQHLVEGLAVEYSGHLGMHIPNNVRHILSSSVQDAHFWHFGVDRTGTRLVTDAGAFGPEQAVFSAEMASPGVPASNWRYLLTPRNRCYGGNHIHPFLSPDGTRAFFNSDESGVMQAYMLTGLPWGQSQA